MFRINNKDPRAENPLILRYGLEDLEDFYNPNKAKMFKQKKTPPPI